jgi:hypothetical protein
MVNCCSDQKGAPTMIRYTSEKEKANRIADLTSLTVEQFEQLVEPFERAYINYMSEWTMEGTPRLARSYTPYKNSPLPTPQDRLLFVLSYMKAASLQVVHAALFDMTQSNANKWIHILLVVLCQTLRDLGDAPARHLQALRDRLDQLYALEQVETEQVETEQAGPLFITTAPSAQSRAPKTVMSRTRVIAARRSATT